MTRIRLVAVAVSCALASGMLGAGSVPVRARHGIVASQNEIASRIGADVIKEGGTALDAAVATAFALAVVHPTAGNIGRGGFIVFRPAAGDPATYNFPQTAPAIALATH